MATSVNTTPFPYEREPQFCPHRGCGAGPFRSAAHHHAAKHREWDHGCDICRAYDRAAEKVRRP